MIPDANQIGSKATRYLIGASIVMLALILFSEFSCQVLGLCKNWFPPAELVGFWEMMGISVAGLFAGLSIRTLRHRGDSERTEPAIPNTPQSSDHIEPTSPPAPPSSSTNSRWRALFNQLSEEERQTLKTIMEEHCVDSTDVTRENNTSHGPSSAS